MKAHIVKLVLLVTVLVSCFSAIHLLQQADTSSSQILFFYSDGDQDTFYKPPVIPVYKGSESSSSSYSEEMVSTLPLYPESSYVLPGRNHYSSSAETISTYGETTSSSTRSTTGSSASAAGFVLSAYGSHSSLSDASQVAASMLQLKPGASADLLYIPPDNGDDDGPPPTPLAVPNGWMVLIFMIGGYLVFLKTKMVR